MEKVEGICADPSCSEERLMSITSIVCQQLANSIVSACLYSFDFRYSTRFFDIVQIIKNLVVDSNQFSKRSLQQYMGELIHLSSETLSTKLFQTVSTNS